MWSSLFSYQLTWQNLFCIFINHYKTLLSNFLKHVSFDQIVSQQRTSKFFMVSTNFSTQELAQNFGKCFRLSQKVEICFVISIYKRMECFHSKVHKIFYFQALSVRFQIKLLQEYIKQCTPSPTTRTQLIVINSVINDFHVLWQSKNRLIDSLTHYTKSDSGPNLLH